MKLASITFCLGFLFMHCTMDAQSIYGKWKSIDDKSGKAKAIIKIYEEDGKTFGKIERIFKETERKKLCTACKGDKKNEPIEGLVIIEGLEENESNIYGNGTVTNPDNGKTYDCKIWLDEENPDLLNVRGYVSILYRTQIWERL